MATVYKTPGVYIEEIPKFPPLPRPPVRWINRSVSDHIFSPIGVVSHGELLKNDLVNEAF